MNTYDAISIQDLENDKDSRSVWVINNAAQKFGRPTVVTVDVRNQDGKHSSIAVPATWIPIDLSIYASKDYITGSTTFRRAVANQMLIPLKEKDALAILATPKARRERDRLQSIQDEYLRGNDIESSHQGRIKIGPDGKPVLDVTGNPVTETGKELSLEDSATPAVVAAVQGASEPNSNVDLAAEVLRLASILTENDKKYIRSMTDDPEVLELL